MEPISPKVLTSFRTSNAADPPSELAGWTATDRGHLLVRPVWGSWRSRADRRPVLSAPRTRRGPRIPVAHKPGSQKRLRRFANSRTAWPAARQRQTRAAIGLSFTSLLTAEILKARTSDAAVKQDRRDEVLSYRQEAGGASREQSGRVHAEGAACIRPSARDGLADHRPGTQHRRTARLALERPSAFTLVLRARRSRTRRPLGWSATGS